MAEENAAVARALTTEGAKLEPDDVARRFQSVDGRQVYEYHASYTAKTKEAKIEEKLEDVSMDNLKAMMEKLKAQLES